MRLWLKSPELAYEQAKKAMVFALEQPSGFGESVCMVWQRLRTEAGEQAKSAIKRCNQRRGYHATEGGVGNGEFRNQPERIGMDCRGETAGERCNFARS